MKRLISALLSVAILLAVPIRTPINNMASVSESKTVSATAPEKVVQVETPKITATTVTPPVISEKQPTPPIKVVAVAIPPITEQEAKAFIYLKESGNRPHAKNSIGCYGLGQDCNGIVERKCGADYSCQDHFFTDYMLRRYGTWQAAKSFWLARTPINGRDVGHWW